jgi:uncharacterized C2H2 Zn-finger protein
MDAGDSHASAASPKKKKKESSEADGSNTDKTRTAPQCPKCKKVFRDKRGFKVHVRSCTECPTCHKFFKSSHARTCTAARVEPGCDATGAGSELPADQPDAHMDAGDSHASAATPAHSESLESSTSAAQSSCGARATLCGTVEYGVLGRDTPLNKLRMWVGGLERIGDAEQVVALLVQSEVSLVNLKLLTVDELAATGVGEAVACELLSQLSSLEQSPRGSPTDE